MTAAMRLSDPAAVEAEVTSMFEAAEIYRRRHRHRQHHCYEVVCVVAKDQHSEIATKNRSSKNGGTAFSYGTYFMNVF